MKTLILIRHGKSDWSAGVSDMERPLNHRGLNDAPRMASILLHKGLTPELIYYSSAKRTTQTTTILAEELSIHKTHLIKSPELYLCPAFAIEEVIQFAPSEANIMAIVGHNPTLSEVASNFSKKGYMDMPPLGIFIATFDTDDWATISEDNLKEQQFLSPKHL